MLALLAAGLFAGWKWLLPELGNREEPASAVVEFTRSNCRYARPDSPWEKDKSDVGLKLSAALVMRRSGPRAWLALIITDYKDRTPSDSKVLDEALRHLGNGFHKESLEWQQEADGQLGGQRAQCLLFQGDVAGQPISGECYILAHRGLVYWFLTWAPAEELQAGRPEFESLRQRFSLLNERAGWKEKRPAVRTFAGHGAAYTLEDTEALWQEWTPAADFGGPQADLALVAHAGDAPESKPVATVLVSLLKERTEDVTAAVRLARTYVEARQKVPFPQSTVESVADPALEVSTKLGAVPGRLVALHVTNDERRQRYILLGVVRGPEQVFVVQGECAWQVRESWQGNFRRLLATFALGKKESG
jgi:hypothetical protein